MRNTLTSVSAEEMGEMMGASRTTARRYLEYLTSTGEGSTELEYGIVGRPERRYITIDTPKL
jgi:CitB family two-component system response regulator CitT